MFLSTVCARRPKGNIQVKVEDNAGFGPVAAEIKGIRGSKVWVANTILTQHPDRINCLSLASNCSALHSCCEP